MPVEVEVSVDEGFAALTGAWERWLPALARRTAEGEGIENGAISVLITDDETVHALNREYRDHDEPTDVLSFGLSDLAKPATDDEEAAPEFVLPPDALPQLGEVVIAYPTALRQAAVLGRVPDMELAHLLIHGVLHLLGHDHYEAEEERVIRAREESLLATRPWEQA